MEITQLIMTSTHDILESPKMPQWDWNYPAHNLRHANRLMDNSATSRHLSNLWLIHPPALLLYMLRVKPSITSKCSLQLHKMSTTTLPYSDHTRCLDTHCPSYGPCHHHNSNMPRETYGNNCNPMTTTSIETAYSLQCHFGPFLPSTQI